MKTALESLDALEVLRDLIVKMLTGTREEAEGAREAIAALRRAREEGVQ